MFLGGARVSTPKKVIEESVSDFKFVLGLGSKMVLGIPFLVFPFSLLAHGMQNVVGSSRQEEPLILSV